jgi:uncharacterized protein (TIGR00297 family)
MVVWALLLRWLSWKAALLLAVAAFVHNAVVLPRRGGDALLRDADRARGWAPGIVLYPLSIAVLVVLFRSQLAYVAAGWGLLALGDGMAGLVGASAGRRRLPWNPAKTWEGLLAHLVFGGAAAFFLMRWVEAGLPDLAWAPPLVATLAVPAAAGVAALASAVAETLELGLDDNVVVPFVGAGVAWLVLTATSLVALRDPSELALRATVAAILCLGLAVAASLAATITASGGVAAVLVGTTVATFGGWGAFACLVAFFALGTGATRLGRRVKVGRGIGEARGGRRSVANVLANGGVAAACALVTLPEAATLTSVGALGGLALTAALATAAFDTVSSEVGKAYGRHTVLPTTGASVPPGTEGAISLEGTACGAAAAILVGVVGWLGGLMPEPGGEALMAVVVGALVGTTFESVVSARLDAHGLEVDNHALNFANTLVGALAAVAFFLA